MNAAGRQRRNHPGRIAYQHCPLAIEIAQQSANRDDPAALFQDPPLRQAEQRVNAANETGQIHSVPGVSSQADLGHTHARQHPADVSGREMLVHEAMQA